MKRAFFPGLLLPLALLAATPVRADDTRSAGLSFTPYSSSYLPRKIGFLSVKGAAAVSEFADVLAPEIVDAAKAGSTIERFDEARAKVLGVTEALAPAIARSHHDPSAESWEGFCHQWSAAALNPEISEILAGTQGIVCRGVLLSRGELKELFTGLYEYLGHTEYYGKRTWSEESPRVTQAKARAGLDDFPAALFYEQLYRHLESGRGVVLDVDPGVQVWNQPVYEARSTLHDVDSESELAELALKTPTHVYEAEDADSREALAEIQRIDLSVIGLFQGMGIGEHVAKELRKLFHGPFRKVLGPAFTGDPTMETLLGMRERLIQNVLVPLIRAKKVTLKSGLTLKKVSTRIKYGIETGFASKTLASSAFKTYDFLLVQRGAEVIDSAWTGPLADRPDFMWVPPAGTVDELARAGDYPGATVDLVKLIRGCTDIKQVLGFLRSLDEAISDNKVTETEKKQLLEAFAKVRSAVNRDKVAVVFNGKTIAGLSVKDFYP